MDLQHFEEDSMVVEVLLQLGVLPSRTEPNYQRLGFGSLIFGRARIRLGFLYFLKSRLELEFGSSSSSARAHQDRVRFELVCLKLV